nr:hypothetical protein Iba_chr13fCG4090 [Ipomoea batatas]
MASFVGNDTISYASPITHPQHKSIGEEDPNHESFDIRSRLRPLQASTQMLQVGGVAGTFTVESVFGVSGKAAPISTADSEPIGQVNYLGTPTSRKINFSNAEEQSLDCNMSDPLIEE